MMYDITILTDDRFLEDRYPDQFRQNVLEEDGLLKESLESLDLKVARTNWDDPSFDWKNTRFAIFRTTWDYADRYAEFSRWLEKVSTQTQLINPKDIIYWNLDKFYLKDMQNQGVPIPPTIFIESGDQRSLDMICKESNWSEYILKPAVAGGARHTYRFDESGIHDHESIYRELINEERMLLQEFQVNVLDRGEVSLMVFGGEYSHSVLKKAKSGDFRVQDDFGGTLHNFTPSEEDIELAEKAISVCSPQPIYARVDIMWDNNGDPCIGELELIEPELWFRRNSASAMKCAEAIQTHLQAQSQSLAQN